MRESCVVSACECAAYVFLAHVEVDGVVAAVLSAPLQPSITMIIIDDDHDNDEKPVLMAIFSLLFHTHTTLLPSHTGYKMYGSDQPYSFKTIKDDQLGDKQATIDGLKRFTKYSIVLQAYNSIGSGPRSTEIISETLEMDPPPAPVLSLGQVTFNSIELHWNFDGLKDSSLDEQDTTADTSLINSYLIYIKRDQFGWEEKQVVGSLSAFTFSDLNCGTKYQFYVIAINNVGRGKPSQAIVAKTKGSSKCLYTLDCRLALFYRLIFMQC